MTQRYSLSLTRAFFDSSLVLFFASVFSLSHCHYLQLSKLLRAAIVGFDSAFALLHGVVSVLEVISYFCESSENSNLISSPLATVSCSSSNFF